MFFRLKPQTPSSEVKFDLSFFLDLCYKKLFAGHLSFQNSIKI